MKEEYTKEFNFTEIEKKINQKLLENKSALSRPDHRTKRFVVMMPLPNVTGALHMGHAIDNVMQDMLTRWYRMQNYNTLWMPGTDHAGIATQAIVEKRIFELEGKTRHDIGKEALVKKIWEWKDEYEKRIIHQQQKMGCSCDWTLHRFTMDKVCKRAVQKAFFQLFQDGLIFRGNRLVNWDCHLQTAISDDEIIRKNTLGNFWHIKYPVINPSDDEPKFITIATTRPETMLGDTAIAVHPDPRKLIKQLINDVQIKLKKAPKKDQPQLQIQLERLNQRNKDHLPHLLKLVQMAKSKKKILLPLLEREIPLILDEWAKPELGSGCVKITPAHDPNDYDVWQRHIDEIDIINLLNHDGTYNINAGKYQGQDRMEVRKAVIEDLIKVGLLKKIEEHEIELGYSDRSKTPIEPYFSKQWFVNMGDLKDGVICGKNTKKTFKTRGLAQAAINAVNGEWKSASGRNLTFFPDSKRYRKTFVNWLEEKRDWCISRQLWWGHDIPIWHGPLSKENLKRIAQLSTENDQIAYWVSFDDGTLKDLSQIKDNGPFYTLVGLGSDQIKERFSPLLKEFGLKKDPDVLDTWFSSALWPFSTLGWPNPDTAEVGKDRHPLGSENNSEDFLNYYYPGSCLVTARDIITLWVARMTIFGLYFLGDVPFTDCFIHATIQDGKGERMSKSKGNGIDPIDIIQEFGADAMRYVLCDMQTGNQDIKLPVQAISPFTGEFIPLSEAKHGQTIFTYIDPKTNKEFDVLGTIPSLPKARITSTRFNLGKAFCIKLWNAVRFALLNLDDYQYQTIKLDQLILEDLWILSRLSKTVELVSDYLKKYNPSAAIGRAREFFWSDFCDWYLEIIKSRIKDQKTKSTVQMILALVIDNILRLFHPFIPYITEALWEMLNSIATPRGLTTPLPHSDMLISSLWPQTQKSWIHKEAESTFSLMQRIIRSIRDLKSQYNVSPRKIIDAVIKVPKSLENQVNQGLQYFEEMAFVKVVDMGNKAQPPPNSAIAIVSKIQIHLSGLLDPQKEITKLNKQKMNLQQLINQSEQLLKNPKFLEKAPQKVVKAEEQKRADLKNQIERIYNLLKKLN